MANTIKHQLPEWEVAAPKKSSFSKFTAHLQSSPSYAKEAPSEDSTPVKRTFFGRLLPPWACMGRNRKSMLCSIAVLIILIALILGLGLGLGLSHKSKKTKNLPLPTTNGVFNGDLTYYSPGPGFGACGFENTATDSICAIAHALWDSQLTSSNPNENPLCGKKIRITRYNEAARGNRSVDVTVVDKCMGCEPTDLDLSIKMFTTLADESLGRVVGTWAWLN
ncbi:riboflavin aldehyde-forming enzyme [Diplocarpon rosae]|nr:riboflavin aldehyde-forming enzyme [Diplocarpon rosae]